MTTQLAAARGVPDMTTTTTDDDISGFIAGATHDVHCFLCGVLLDYEGAQPDRAPCYDEARTEVICAACRDEERECWLCGRTTETVRLKPAPADAKRLAGQFECADCCVHLDRLTED